MTEFVLTPSQRFRSLTATIVAMGVTSAIYSLTLPLFSTRLDAMGHSETVIGINAAAQSIALLGVAPFMPSILRRFGAAWPMIWGFVATLVIFLLCPLWENAWYWLVLRLGMGITSGVVWIAGEAWINEASVDESRGRSLALYGISGAVGTMVGFGIIFVIGHEGWMPFLVMAGLVVICLAVVAPAISVAPPFQGEAPRGLIQTFLAAPSPMLINLLVAVTFGSLSSFLAIYGGEIGLAVSTAYLLLVLLSLGGILQYPIGWLADRMDRRLLALGVLVFMVVLFSVMGDALRDPILRWPYAVVLGAGMMSLYTIGLIFLGARFRGSDLGAATTMFQVMFHLGIVAGPFAVGFAMDEAGPAGLPWTLALFFVAVIGFMLLRGRRP